ncbi:hypothetical protein OROGR_006004 [Orobanche gracilis]
MSIVAEAPGFLQVFSDGTVKRFSHQMVPPSSNISNKYYSKDVIIDPLKPITARIFVPTDSKPPQFPVLVYFHGGGFCIGSTTWLGYHTFLGNLSAIAQAVVLSVDYRLAPENKLPIAYDDGFATLKWLGSESDSEPWLRQTDLSRVFLSGDSAGGNIAHEVALQAIINKDIPNVRIKGLLPIHPFFGSESRTELEMADGSANEVAMNDMFWKLSLPEGSSRDFYGCNFEKGEMNDWGLFPAVMVFVAGLDFLKERGVMYAEFLKKKGVKIVSLVEAEEEPHVFHAWNPESEATCLLQEHINRFMKA